MERLTCWRAVVLDWFAWVPVSLFLIVAVAGIAVVALVRSA